MKSISVLALFLGLTTSSLAADKPGAEEGFVGLFDGKTLDGWKVGQNADTFQVRDGRIVVNGPVAHLFYVGDVNGHAFKNFHFKADVMTFPQANSGLYFHTKYQEEGWPKYGYEAQVNNSHKDWRRTGSLYAIKDVSEAPAKDNTWFTEEIIVQGKHIVIKVDGKTVVDYTEPEGVTGDRRLSKGTFALQGHDPGSTVHFKNIRVKVLPD
ncbi:MAG: DUF1080 domain-containing protein [Pirellulales bacterium]|nr:DUF1080 domain-containing protein [Pirellulales bacterium]